MGQIPTDNSISFYDFHAECSNDSCSSLQPSFEFLHFPRVGNNSLNSGAVASDRFDH